jgi:hypothetical protein
MHLCRMQLMREYSIKLIKTSLLGVVLIIYYLFLVKFGYGIPCLFHRVTGLLCPGCGVTHLIVSILHLDFKSAFESNQLIFITSPILFYFFIRLYLSWFRNKKYKLNKVENILVYFLIILFVSFGIVRNLF